MPSVYASGESNKTSTLLRAVVAASTLHVGGAAAAVSMRRDLVEGGSITDHDFNECFAVARLTPGTNLLALYALLGFLVASWRGALASVVLGTVVSGVIATSLAALYVTFAANPLVSRALEGAGAGALAVFLWAAVRLARPVLSGTRWRGALFAAAVVIAALSGLVSPFTLVALSGAVGALLFKT